MAGENIETDDDEVKPNGAAKLSHEQKWAADRAAFMSGAELEDDDAAGDKKKPIVDDEDLDKDLEDEDDKDDIDADDQEDDEDSDLDDDEDKEEEDDKEDDEDVDADTSKRLAQVRRHDKRLREQRDKYFTAREAELETKVKEAESRFSSEVEKWRPRIEAAERFERLAARANIDPAAVLQALGLKEDRYEHAAQVLYTLSKAKTGDEKARAAAAQLMKASEIDAELAELKKWREDREKADKDRELETAEEKKWDSYFDRVTKMIGDKTPLAQKWLKSNAAAARDRMHVITAELARAAGGKVPTEREVMIALEKDRRRALRDLGIDPKTISASAATAVLEDKKKATPKPDGKKASKKPKGKDDEDDDEDKPLTKAEFVRRARAGQFD